eukprot:gene32540-42153_t
MRVFPESRVTMYDFKEQESYHGSIADDFMDFNTASFQSSSTSRTMSENYKDLAARSLYRVPPYILVGRVNISMTLNHDEFQVERFLCHGNKSQIYTANVSFGSTVVIKKATSEAYAEKEILNEIQLLIKMKHQNIISIKGARASSLEPFMVLEKLGGGTLSDVIEKHGGLLPRWSALDIALQLITALQYLHEELSPFAMIIHRGR